MNLMQPYFKNADLLIFKRCSYGYSPSGCQAIKTYLRESPEGRTLNHLNNWKLKTRKSVPFAHVSCVE
ncbi:hypothetical protein TNCV_3476941 [Trichonephila clavipes]|nr:hypothetical protein TNCV_3476941 [Trichonephila clavipes]